MKICLIFLIQLGCLVCEEFQLDIKENVLGSQAKRFVKGKFVIEKMVNPQEQYFLYKDTRQPLGILFFQLEISSSLRALGCYEFVYSAVTGKI